MKPKILIAILTYKGHMHVRHNLIKFLRSITYDNCEVFFVTNSGEEDKKNLERRSLLVQKPMLVKEYDPKTSDAKELIAKGRNVIRDHFLEKDYDYMFVLDDDVIGPPDILETLLSHKKDICCGWYMGNMKAKGKRRLGPFVFGFKEGYYCRQLTIEEVLEPKLIKVVMTGMGCCLIKREVIEKVKWRKEGDNATDDTIFFKDCNEEGYEVWCDTSVACWHLKYPKEHPKSKFFNPENYKVKKSS